MLFTLSLLVVFATPADEAYAEGVAALFERPVAAADATAGDTGDAHAGEGERPLCETRK